tara:strand:- start:1354 stop:1962 length:609 start_codon:yes stop_codon:yes gene_type:complete
MWYSLEYNRRIKPKDILTLFKNVSFPSAFAKGFIEITPEIANAAKLIPLLTPAEPEAGVDYDPDFQQPILNFSEVTVNESRTEAFGTWVINNVIQDLLDEDNNIVKTKEQIRKEVDEEWKLQVIEEERAEKEEEENNLSIFNRNDRDRLLSSSDRYLTKDWGSNSEEETLAWTTYRQALRDLTDDSSWPNVSFPTPPSPLTE